MFLPQQQGLALLASLFLSPQGSSSLAKEDSKMAWGQKYGGLGRTKDLQPKEPLS